MWKASLPSPKCPTASTQEKLIRDKKKNRMQEQSRSQSREIKLESKSLYVARWMSSELLESKSLYVARWNVIRTFLYRPIDTMEASAATRSRVEVPMTGLRHLVPYYLPRDLSLEAKNQKESKHVPENVPPYENGTWSQGSGPTSRDHRTLRDDGRSDLILMSFVYISVRAKSNSTNTTWALTIPKWLMLLPISIQLPVLRTWY